METDLIRIEEDKQVYLAQVNDLLSYAKTRTVVDTITMISATDDLGMMATLAKAIEDRRKEYTGPINATLKTINNNFKVVTDPLDEAIKITKQKMLDYRAEVERQRQEAEAINKAKQDIARREMILTGEIAPDTNTTPVEVPEEAVKIARGAVATAGVAKVRKWKVVNFALIPDSWKTTKDKEIQKAIEHGQAIDGIESWQEETIRIR